jgi:hypothetical protein
MQVEIKLSGLCGQEPDCDPLNFGILYHYVHGFDTPFLLKKEHNIAFGVYRRMRFNLVRQPVEIIKNCYSLFSAWF